MNRWMDDDDVDDDDDAAAAADDDDDDALGGVAGSPNRRFWTHPTNHGVGVKNWAPTKTSCQRRSFSQCAT